MRHIVFLAAQLLARGECVQDQVLQARDVVRRSGDVNELLRLFLRGGHGSQVQQVFPEIRHAEDGIGALESDFQRGDIVLVGRSELCSGFDEDFGAGGVFVARDAADSPAFG
jgi:hypothetical protein